ncbi:DUF6414 family protein [Lysinibacillus sp. NPDC093210]|uniref:DUF6414 family protein n=1 Tax=Lysinibacillus sp. NPDC093210 TaxID=3364133 RepID=UPI00382F5957
MRKVIYFDESSALDLIDIKKEGRSQEIIQDIVTKAKGFDLNGGFGTGLLNLLTTGSTGGIKGGVSRNKESIVSINITNTILTSFLELVDKKDKKARKDGEQDLLCTLRTQQIEILPESATYIKVIAPFAKIFKEINGDVIPNMNEYENIDFHSMDDVLANAKGYYELLATDIKNKKCIVRFNLEGFRNNYRIQDLQKMNLILYGVNVGKTSLEMMDFKNELTAEGSNPTELGFSAFDVDNSDGVLEIVDIIFAGVE